jgi:hypothetical protein
VKPITLIAAIVAALVLVPAAAQAEGVDGGNVHLRLAKSLTKVLNREGVHLAAVKPATASRAGVTLPISSGLLEQHFGSGYLFLEGGFEFQAGKRSVKLNRFVLNTTKHSLNANVDGIATKLAKLPEQKATREGFDLDLALRSLQLTPKAAKRLNRKLGLDGVFKAGRSLGLATAVAHFEWLGVTGGAITIALDPAFQEKLASVEASVGPSYSAQLVSASPTTISIPLEGGQIAPDGTTGGLSAEGGLAFTQPEVNEFDEPFNNGISFIYTRISLESHQLSGDANYTPNPKQLPFSGPLATFPSAIAVQNDADSGAISAASIPLALHPNFVAVLNEVLGAPKGKPELFTAGETLGTVAFQALTR